MQHNIIIHKGKNVIEKTASHGISIMDFLADSSMLINTPCRGNRTCGKCRIKILGDLRECSAQERMLLGEDYYKAGYRLACFNVIESDLDIFLDEEYSYSILIEGKNTKSDISSIVEKKFVEDENSGKTIVINNGENVLTETGDTTDLFYGIAFDIGTTTIAAYLYDLKNNKRCDVYSVINPQVKFGADVITRIEYSLESKIAADKVHETVIKCINEIIESLCKNNSIKKNDIYEATFVGNTTMMHFLLNVDATSLASLPFSTPLTETKYVKPGNLGININDVGSLIILPCISAFIGSDTVAATLSSEIFEKEKESLLIDIGTNGEIVMGNKNKLFACSAAAGSAFEGANIKNGIGGVKGAIDAVFMKDNDIMINTIGNIPPVGICGSGIIDIVALMHNCGVLENNGKILSKDEASKLDNESIRARLIKIDGENAFRIYKNDENIDITITQKDIRMIQNAKAAIAAGIKVLLKESKTNIDDIDNLYLAGGFGNFINIESAVTIGLLPKELKEKTSGIGNAAGIGAVECLIAKNNLKMAEKIKNNTKIIELSEDHEFFDIFVDSMNF